VGSNNYTKIMAMKYLMKLAADILTSIWGFSVCCKLDEWQLQVEHLDIIVYL
jgi:hypothetical protein